MLMIVPLMIWSARTLIDNHAWTKEMTRPATTAAANATMSAGVIPNGPSDDDPRIGTARTPAYQPTNAAAIMIPSIPMLTTPARSHITPHSAARAIGVAA